MTKRLLRTTLIVCAIALTACGDDGGISPATNPDAGTSDASDGSATDGGGESDDGGGGTDGGGVDGGTDPDVVDSPSCGDGAVNGDEECEPGDLAGQTCIDQGFVSGILACGDDCTFDTSSCSNEAGATCGDGEVEGDEACDDGNTTTEACAYGEESCTVCASDCTEVAGATSSCGDEEINGPESCDGDALGGATCADRGFDSGTVSCSSTCTLDVSACEGAATIDGDVVGYAGAGAGTRFNELYPLSDGTFLVGGQATSLDWVPDDVPVSEIATTANSRSEGNIGFIAQMAPDASSILHVVHFPAGTVRDVFRIRGTEVPGEATGVLYISGSRDGVGTENDGYYIARLNGNFVDGVPTGLEWSNDIGCEPRRASGFEGQSAYKQLQPWDVDAEGRVIYGRGAEYDFDWAQISAFEADGSNAVIEHWTAHWMTAGGEFYGAASEAPSEVDRSGIVLKAGRRGSLRSLTEEHFNEVNSDGNGRDDRPGRFPDDYFYGGPCIVGGDCPGGPGYTGYRTSDKPTQRLGGIAIDRRSGNMYFGYSTQSVLPGGNPDFEPAVVAMGPDGELLWWNRLYEETDDNSTPDQYVDGVTIDYVNNRVLFLARAHGNNVINLWKGNEIAARPEASGFQNQFTGTNGNIHISWLGGFTLDEGTLLASTYIAEMSEGLGGGVSAFGDDNELLAGQPNPNGGWPDVNTTRCRNTVSVDRAGNVWVACTGRRTITTNNAYQQMEPVDGGTGSWNQFVRGYTPDLSNIVYSTLLTGEWDRVEGGGGGNTWVESILPVAGGVMAVGYHEVTDEGVAEGNPIPVSSVPAWGDEAPDGETGIFAHFVVD